MRDCVITQGSKNEIMMTFFAGTIGCDGPKSLLLPQLPFTTGSSILCTFFLNERDFGSYVVKDLTY